MEPTVSVNYLAILVCVVVAMPLGFLWFGPLFGKTWARHMGMEDEDAQGGMAKAMVIYALGSFLLVFVLAHYVALVRPSAWGVGPDQAPWVYAWNGEFWPWRGFFLPLQMGRVAWEGKKWGLVAINSGFDLVRLLIFAIILTHWH
ncbi:MAG: DUF1761 domain-containing protein [Gammaproteobacteria bacterium]|nr:DUF1761 domain-containing protein [Gammaproteobacteria bacterium]